MRNLWIVSYTVTIGGLGIVVIVTPVILLAFGQTYLYFYRDRFEIRREIFGFCYWRRRGKTSRITNICEQEAQQRGAARGVTIEAGKRKYTTNPLATVERLWLIQEIKDWLGLSR
jgi:hypothetical protein